MVWKIIIEILILWICYALYMAILVHKRGAIGGIFFYPKVM
jgi:hypothetical protein